ncbi:MAG: polysaccharide biosynthesis protein [Clostridia bacterium]|nr:polysaccharide biosynthesis protein [Clostridia bacterium]
MKKSGKFLNRDLILYLIDMSLIGTVHIVVWLFESFINGTSQSIYRYIEGLAAVVIAYLFCFLIFKVNKVIWRYSGGHDYLRIFVASMFGGLFSCALIRLFVFANIPMVFCVLAELISVLLLVFSRVIYRELLNGSKRNSDGERLLIVGAGEAGSRMIAEIKGRPACGLNPIALVDDDVQKHNRSINGVKVMGSVKDIEKICKENDIKIIYIAIPSATNEQRAYILDECAKTTCSVKTLPFLTDIYESNDFISKVRDITPDELLGRDPVDIANEDILSFIKDKTVAITGGGGSIGSELCRIIAAHSPKRLIIIDVYENNAYDIQQELIQKYKDSLDIIVYIATVCDYKKIKSIFDLEKPDVVIHAAAHKHVPLMETVPDEAVKNNVFGTLNTALAAKENKVKKFILISTDKAVNPTNIMGATKRICEMIVQYVDSISTDTVFAAVRFGNVLGSNGSVIPLFKKQIENRCDVTVTHPEMIRYFMTIPEASQLVLTAGAMAEGGEIFVLDMGKPVKIDDLAKKMISLSGLVLGRDINIRYTGLRPGEKLYEELLMSEEGLQKTLNEKIFIGKPIIMDYADFQNQLDELNELVNKSDVTPDEVEEMLHKFVPTFKRYNP